MAIKKRTPVDPALREAQIEAFAAAAEEPTKPAAHPQVTKIPTPVQEKPKPKPLLLRLDAGQHELLKQVAEQQKRSMNNMALLVLIPALEALRDEAPDIE